MKILDNVGLELNIKNIKMERTCGMNVQSKIIETKKYKLIHKRSIGQWEKQSLNFQKMQQVP